MLISKHVILEKKIKHFEIQGNIVRIESNACFLKYTKFYSRKVLHIICKHQISTARHIVKNLIIYQGYEVFIFEFTLKCRNFISATSSFFKCCSVTF